MKKSSRAAVFAAICLVAACDLRPHPSAVSNGPAVKKCSSTIGEFDSQYNRQVRYVSAEPDLNRLQEFFHPVLEANKKAFAGQLGKVKGFGAGGAYPQIWLRDSATIIPLARYHYSLDYLTSWLEEHLSYQQADGQLYDWIAAGAKSNFVGAAPRVREVYRSTESGDPHKLIQISADKNTTESDQETSAVDAAYQIFKITGDRQWLSKKINGRTLLDRLNLALDYLAKSRFDARHGLIKSAFTADWGDVSPIYADQRAIYWDEKTPSVVGVYTNALFSNAARQMEELNMAMSNERMASYWALKSEDIKQNINRHLWREDRGFYQIHLLLTPQLLPDARDDSDIFAMGGNGVAVLYQIADERKAQRILEVAAQRQRQHSISTIAGVLLPAYPRGYFKHPAVSEEYVYQNGGQWDWFAGRLMLAEFERGHSQRAYAELVEIARKAVKNNGLFEWHDRNGEGKGSRDYAGSAGALGGAIFRGLFGVYLNDATLALEIRLGEQPGQIRLYEPTSDHYVSYRYCYDQQSGTVTLDYASNFPNAGQIHILLPANRKPDTVSLDGKQLRFETQRIGDDAYVVVNTDWKVHVLQLKLSDLDLKAPPLNE